MAGAVPASSTQARPPDRCSSPITISPGDTLSSIAWRCGTTVSALIDTNPHLHDPNVLLIGTALALPQGLYGEEVSQIGPTEDLHTIAVEPSTLTPGARVTITASKLPPGARVWIKGGNSRSPKHHLVLRGARVGGQGELRVTLRLPNWLEAGNGGFTLSIEVPRASITLRSIALPVNAAPQTEELADAGPAEQPLPH